MLSWLANVFNRRKNTLRELKIEAPEEKAVAEELRAAELEAAAKRDASAKLDAALDRQWYASRYSDLNNPQINLSEHYFVYGEAEGRYPSAEFCPGYYQHQLSTAGIDSGKYGSLLEHYVFEGKEMGLRGVPDKEELIRLLGENFSEEKYLEANPGVQPGGVVDHLLARGLAENRLSNAHYIDFPLMGPLLANRIRCDLTTMTEMGGIPNVLMLDQRRKAQEGRKSPDTASLSVVIGIVLYENSKAELARLLRSLPLGRNHTKVIILDNSSDWEEHVAFRASLKAPNIRYIDLQENLGFSKGHNELMRIAFAEQAGVDFYFGLNPDGALMPGALDLALDDWHSHESAEKTGIMDLLTEPVCHPKWYDPLSGQTAWSSGVAFLLPRAGYEASGGFDPDFPMYGEDVDLSYRLREAGFLCRTSLRGRIYHDVSARLYEDNPSREVRQLIGNWFFLKKWGQDERAEILATMISELGTGPEALAGPAQTITPSPEVLADLLEPRYAVSRFF